MCFSQSAIARFVWVLLIWLNDVGIMIYSVSGLQWRWKLCYANGDLATRGAGVVGFSAVLPMRQGSDKSGRGRDNRWPSGLAPQRQESVATCHQTHHYAHNDMHVWCSMCYTWSRPVSGSNTPFFRGWLLKSIDQWTYNCCWFHSAICCRRHNDSAWFGTKKGASAPNPKAAGHAHAEFGEIWVQTSSLTK